MIRESLIFKADMKRGGSGDDNKNGGILAADDLNDICVQSIDSQECVQIWVVWFKQVLPAITVAFVFMTCQVDK